MTKLKSAQETRVQEEKAAATSKAANEPVSEEEEDQHLPPCCLCQRAGCRVGGWVLTAMVVGCVVLQLSMMDEIRLKLSRRQSAISGKPAPTTSSGGSSSSSRPGGSQARQDLGPSPSGAMLMLYVDVLWCCNGRPRCLPFVAAGRRWAGLTARARTMTTMTSCCP